MFGWWTDHLPENVIDSEALVRGYLSRSPISPYSPRIFEVSPRWQEKRNDRELTTVLLGIQLCGAPGGSDLPSRIPHERCRIIQDFIRDCCDMGADQNAAALVADRVHHLIPSTSRISVVASVSAEFSVSLDSSKRAASDMSGDKAA